MLNKDKVARIIFLSDTRAGKAFDVALIVSIIVSTILVMIETVPSIYNVHEFEIEAADWTINTLFTIEYILRIWVSKNKKAYIFSFYGIIDFLSILPNYIGIFVNGAEYLSVIRAIRIIRVFRVLKLTRFIGEAELLKQTLKNSRYKITVFLIFIAITVIIFGTILYLVEGPQNGFENIPKSVYWAVVTLTTVGYGDISPNTALGQFISSVIMLLGYGLIAVPTGIVSSEFTTAKNQLKTKVCPTCNETVEKEDPYCKNCGTQLIYD